MYANLLEVSYKRLSKKIEGKREAVATPSPLSQ
jgi:hypothetical protein